MATPILRRVLRFRWVLYLVLATVFGIQAYQARCAPRAPAATEEFGGLKPTRFMVGPDGQQVPVFELTPEEAEKHFGAKPPSKPAAPDAASATTTTSADAPTSQAVTSSGADTAAGAGTAPADQT